MASPDANDLLGELLEQRYGGDKPQDLHIDLFYLILGYETVGRVAEVYAKLQQTPGIQVLGTLQGNEWPEFLVVEFPKRSPCETERQREERLNDTVRKPLLTALAQEPNNPPCIIISRVCKYNKPVVAKNHLTTFDVETALSSPYDQHLDYFYLFIRSPKPPTDILITQLLTEEKRIWKTMSSKDTWPLTLLGHFPKEQFESEREREWRLNTRVRKPLKDAIEGTISPLKEQESEKKTVIVLFTRVCQYSNM